MKKVFVFFMFTYLLTAYSSLTVASKKFSESVILAEITSLLLEKKYGIAVERQYFLGGTQIAFNGLRSGEIDLYPEYTGTGLVVILAQNYYPHLKEQVLSLVQQGFKEQFQIHWSAPFGFNNTYALAKRKDDQRLKGVNKISDLQKIKNFDEYLIAGAYEFMQRADGMSAFLQHYGLQVTEDHQIAMDAGLMYGALKGSEVDLVVAYSTDGRIAKYDLVLLEDDLSFFPPYHAALLAREETLQNYPQLQELFELTGNLLDTETMTKLNQLVDQQKYDFKVVAENFLVEKGLIDGELKDYDQSIDWWEQRYYLWGLTQQHLNLCLWTLLFSLLFSLPLAILMTRFSFLAKIVFPVVNTLQTVPSLALLGIMVPLVGIGFLPALIALFCYSLLPLIRNTYLGIKEIQPDYIEASRALGLTSWQILLKVEIPLALPIIIGGLRTSAVMVIGTATLAALVGAGGFGDPIFRGVATVNNQLILMGAIPSALSAILADRLFSLLELRAVSKGLRIKQ